MSSNVATHSQQNLNLTAHLDIIITESTTVDNLAVTYTRLGGVHVRDRNLYYIHCTECRCVYLKGWARQSAADVVSTYHLHFFIYLFTSLLLGAKRESLTKHNPTKLGERRGGQAQCEKQIQGRDAWERVRILEITGCPHRKRHVAP